MILNGFKGALKQLVFARHLIFPAFATVVAGEITSDEREPKSSRKTL
jgi:hypothetical protein